MRGAYYVTTALLVVASSRTAAESGKAPELQTYSYDVMAANNVVVTTLPQRFLRGSRDVHDSLVHTTADEERDEFDLLPAVKVFMKVLGTAPMTDEEKGVVVSATAVIEASEKAQLDLRRSGTATLDDGTSHWLSKEWMELAKKIHLQPPKSIENPVISDGAYASEQPGTSRKRNHLASTVERQNKRGPFILDSTSENVQPELQVKPPSATATKRDVFLDRLSKERLELTSDMWAELIDMEPTSNKPYFSRAIPLGTNSPTTRHPQISDDTGIDAIYSELINLCSPSYNPTRYETALLWSLKNWKKRSTVRKHLQMNAKHEIVNGMSTLLEDDSMFGYWIFMPKSRKTEILNDLLNVHYRKWVWMYMKFITEKIGSPKPIAPPESATAGLVPNVGPGLQTNFGDAMGTSSVFAQPGHVTSQDSHLI